MPRSKKWSWLTFLAPVLLCVPCLLAPLLIVAGGALIAALGGAVTGSLVIAAAVLVVAGAVAAVLARGRLRRSGSAAGCAITALVDRQDAEAREPALRQ